MVCLSGRFGRNSNRLRIGGHSNHYGGNVSVLAAGAGFLLGSVSQPQGDRIAFASAD